MKAKIRFEMKVNFKKLVSEARMPERKHKSDAGYDLTATSVNRDENGNVVYGTGIALEIPDGFVGLVFPRSSNASKSLMLTNSVGVIDSGYRGEITMKFRHLPSANDSTYEVGDRIGQLIIIPIPEIQFEEADVLAPSDRGNGGYGSTGK